ncbi:MAG: hypothetical protein HYZ53_02800 [Planctomycetes bacterium]|nr:hypothetical protein [Planctomycetota bacterium]
MFRPLRLGSLTLPLLLLVCGFARAADEPEAAPPKQRTVAYLGFHIVDIRNVDLKSQSFFADLYMWMRFNQTDEAAAKEIEEKLEVMNGKFDSKEEADRKKIGDETYVCWRVTGTFFFEADLHKYPFDSQRMSIILENSNLEVDSLILADDRTSYERSKAPPNFWGVKEGLHIPEYHLTNVERLLSTSVYSTDFGDPTRPQASSEYARIEIALHFQRDYLSYILKIVVPLIIIIGMAYLVFWLPAEEVGTSSAIAITSLLSCMAYNVAVSQDMPQIGYLVISDKFFIASYILLFITLAETVVTYVLDKNDNPALANRLELASRILFPLASVGVFGLLILGGVPAAT